MSRIYTGDDARIWRELTEELPKTRVSRVRVQLHGRAAQMLGPIGLALTAVCFWAVVIGALVWVSGV